MISRFSKFTKQGKHFRFSNIFILIFLLIILFEVSYFNSTRNLHNPKTYPYRLVETPINNTALYSSDLQSVKFLNKSTRSLVTIHENNGTCEFRIVSPKGKKLHEGILGGWGRIPGINPVDADNNGLDELFHVLSYPTFPFSGDTTRIEGVLLCVHNNLEKKTILDNIGFSDLIGDTTFENEPFWGVNARVLKEADLVTPASSGEHFAVGVWGTREARTHRWIYIYESGNPPKRVSKHRTEFYPVIGQWHELPNEETVLTICGSSYKYSSSGLMQEQQASGLNPVDFIDDNHGAIIQYDTRGNVRWQLPLETKVGEVGLFADENPKKPIVAYYCQDILTVGQSEETTTVLILDRFNGSVINRSKLNGKFIPFAGITARECDYLGLVRMADKKARLLRKDGSFDNAIEVYLNKSQEFCPIVQLKDEEIVFAAKYGDDVFFLYNFDGGIESTGKIGSRLLPIRLTGGGDSRDYLATGKGANYSLLTVVPGGFLWRMIKWRWELLILFIFPVAIGINIWISNAGSRAHRTMMRDFNRLEARVEKRTETIRETNQLLNVEIEQRTKAELELQRNHAHLDAIFNSVFDGIVSLDQFSRILNANSAFCDFFNLLQDNVTGVELKSLFSEGYDFVQALISKAIDSRTPAYDPHIEIVTAFGDIKIIQTTVRLLSISEDNNAESLLVIRDVTQLYLHKGNSASVEGFHDIIGNSPPMQDVFRLIDEVSSTATNVLITGESGTGKELVAKAIHYKGKRSEGPFIAVNCAALSGNLLESELFGHVKGSFTGATRDRKGVFEEAMGGTLFLDEIGDVPADMQAKLLRVLEENEYVRVGESKPRKTDARIVAATNQDLKKKVADLSFREDLFYRLSVFTIAIPPLRDRLDDLPLLVDYFRDFFNESLDRKVMDISDVAMELLIDYHWPGNVRELRNSINGAMILCHDEILEPGHFHPEFLLQHYTHRPKPGTTRDIFVDSNAQNQTKDKLSELIGMLKQNFWNVTKTAKHLGVSRTYIYKKLKEHNIDVPR